jgi:hypothetical protein
MIYEIICNMWLDKTFMKMFRSQCWTWILRGFHEGKCELWKL